METLFRGKKWGGRKLVFWEVPIARNSEIGT